jgi:hypothetical protein
MKTREGKTMLDWKVVTPSVGSFTAITFILCVAYGLVVPERFHAARVLEAMLPGFQWLTVGSFFLGLAETLVYGAWAGLLFTGVYNVFFAWRGRAATAGGAVRPQRVA